MPPQIVRGFPWSDFLTDQALEKLTVTALALLHAYSHDVSVQGAGTVELQELGWDFIRSRAGIKDCNSRGSG